MNTKTKGDRTEAIIIAELLKHGLSLSIPFGDNLRYDLIIDDANSLKRVQCKTGRYKNGCVCFNTASIVSRAGGKAVRASYDTKQIEAFAVYCYETDKLYIVPVEDTPSTEMALRVVPSKNGRISGIHLAEDYELKSR